MSLKGLQKRLRVDGSHIWYIDKRVRRYGRLCESTGTADRDEAERYLLHRLQELREVLIYGERPIRTFGEAVRQYIAENADKKSIDRERRILRKMESLIGHLPLNRINNDSFSTYRSAQKCVSIRTRNQKLAIARRLLRLAARVWCFPGTNMTWLDRAPEIQMETGHRPRAPYPLDERQQQLLLSELGAEAAEMATFAVNIGTRDQELCRLQWKWERRLITPSSPCGWRSVFVLPGEVVKNGEPRVLVLNDVAQAVLERARGIHRRIVFVSRHSRTFLTHLRSAGWDGARRRAAGRYPEWFGMAAPVGFRNVRVHDLRHTYGRRLRSAGVSLEDRRDLLGHRGPDITTHYSAPEIGRLVAAANRILERSRETYTPTLRGMAEWVRK